MILNHTKIQKTTIKEALREGVIFLRDTSLTFGLDSEILLSEIIKKPREYLFAHNDETISFDKLRKYHQWLIKRRKGLPIPYITGNKFFLDHKFTVDKYVLVPRPETEALVLECIKIAKSSTLPPIIADIGTGSGIIAISLALAIPGAKIIATDKSSTALKVASRNAKKHRVAKRVTFFASDLLNEIPQELLPTIIVANLPYVTSDQLKHASEKPDTLGLTFEPQGALDGGPDGLAVFRRFFAQISRFPQVQNNLQYLLLEHNPKQRRALWQIAHDFLPEFAPHEITPFTSRWDKVR
jgi:release factor glutamine methyltransferase